MSIKYKKSQDSKEVVEKYVGQVVHLEERNRYDDSNYVAVILTEDNEFESICYDTTRAYTGCVGAEIDAPKEVRERYFNQLEEA